MELKVSSYFSPLVRNNPEDAKAIAAALNANEKSGRVYLWRTVRDYKSEHRDKNHEAWKKKQQSEAAIPVPGRKPDVPLEALYRDAITPAYPEALALSAAGYTQLVLLWRAWRIAKQTEWALGKYKSTLRWANQIKNRNWKPDEITETILKGRQYPAPNKINPNNKAVRYEYKDRYIVRDEVTKEIIQISEPHFIRPLIKGN